jgi:hypothetical protein
VAGSLAATVGPSAAAPAAAPAADATAKSAQGANLVANSVANPVAPAMLAPTKPATPSGVAAAAGNIGAAAPLAPARPAPPATPAAGGMPTKTAANSTESKPTASNPAANLTAANKPAALESAAGRVPPTVAAGRSTPPIPSSLPTLPQAVGESPLVQRTAHTVAQRPVGSNSRGDSSHTASDLDDAATALASDDFSAEGVTGTAAGRSASAHSTEGLRQPNSVLTPSAAPGPVNLETGNDPGPIPNRTPTYGRPEPAAPRYGTATLFDGPGTGEVSTRTSTQRAPAAPDARQYPAGYQTPPGSYAAAGDEPTSPRNLPTLPRRPMITREDAEPLPTNPYYGRGGPAAARDVPSREAPVAAAPPEKKSLFGGVSKLFGKSEPVVVEDSPYTEPAPSTYPRNSAAASRQFEPPADRIASPETETEPASGGFPLLRSLFGNKTKEEAAAEPWRVKSAMGAAGGGSARHDSGKPANAAPKSRGIFGSRASAAPPAAEAAEREYAIPSGYTAEADASARARVPTAQYEAPVGGAPRTLPASGGPPQATDLESPHGSERVSAGLPWYERMIR